MSVSIDIENFPKWSDIFKEIEKQQNVNASTASDPQTDNIQKSGQPRVARSSNVPEPDSTRFHRNVSTATDSEKDNVHTGREARFPSMSMLEVDPTRRRRFERVRTLTGDGRKVEAIDDGKPMRRQASVPCFSATFDADKILQDPRLTDAAKTLDKEKLALLYEDILKPLDVESLLHERRTQSFET